MFAPWRSQSSLRIARYPITGKSFIERKRLFVCIIVLKQRNAQAGTRIACVTRPEAVSAAGLGGGGGGGYIICFQNCFQRPTMHQVAPRVIIKYATEKSGVD